MSFPSFRKPKKPTSLRKKWDDDDDDSSVPASVAVSMVDDEPEEKPIKSRSTNSRSTTQKPKQAVSSFDNEEDYIDPKFQTFKFKKANPLTISSSQSVFASIPSASSATLNKSSVDSFRSGKAGSYTPEILAEMKRQQAAVARPVIEFDPNDIKDPGSGKNPENQKTVIPDAKQIHAARLLREKRRTTASILQETTPSYIPLDESTVSRRYGESRLLTEDQEIDGEEAFEDNQGNTIEFGAQTAKKVKENFKRAMQDEIMMADQDIEDDSEVKQWELQQISKGHCMDLELADMSAVLKKPPMSNDIQHVPEIAPIPSVPDIIFTLDKQIMELTDLANEHTFQLNSSLAEINASEQAIIKMDLELKLLSERYDYFQQLFTYVIDLDGFLDAKLTTLEELEQDLHSWRMVHAKDAVKAVQTRLNELFTTFSGSDRTDADMNENQEHTLPTQSVEQIMDQHRTLLDDAKKQYRKLSVIKDRFQIWKCKFPKEYDQAYGSLSLVGAFALHVRFEHFGWEPFKVPLNFEETNWHQELCSFGISDERLLDPDEADAMLVSKVMEKTIIPQLVIAMDTFDPFSGDQTKLFIRILDQLLDYTECSSTPFKNLVDAFLLRFKTVLDSATQYTCNPLQLVNVSNRQAAVSAKLSWFSIYIQLLSNLISCEKHVGAERIQSLVVTIGINNVLLKALDGSLSYENDMELYEMIVAIIPSSWIPAERFQTPKFLEYFEQVFVTNVCAPFFSSKWTKSEQLLSLSLLRRAMNTCVAIKSLDRASRLSKLLKASEQ
ncbi:hypothetical protein BDV3_005058 [Batrachochytrium dendrobatidis]|nr:hypothetical protein QVD99_002517 [Batrachochytrium dendrobatidis]